LAFAALLLAAPVAVPAVTLSGAMVYATDEWGNPNSWTGVAFWPGQLWHTQLGGEWYGLGIMPGLPPTNSDEALLNLPDFSIHIPLSEGENDFTLVGEPGPMSKTDDYTYFSVNLYFDGVLDHPGISVLFPKYAPLGGDAPIPNQSDVIYTLSVVPAQTSVETTYTDGVDTVTVLAVSFLPPEKSKMDYDKVQAQQTIPSFLSSRPPPDQQGAGLDYVGVLKIDVEGPGSSGPVGVFPGPAAFGVVPGAAVGPDLSGPAMGAPAVLPAQPIPAADAGAIPQPAAAPAATQQPQVATGDEPTPAETEPTVAGLTPTPDVTVSAPGATPTPARTTATAAATSIRTAAAGTPTPAEAHAAATLTPRGPKPPKAERK
jgi:hypothetical protein